MSAIAVLQTRADREFQALLEALVAVDFPAPWDAAPASELGLTDTQPLRALPETPAAFVAGDQAHDCLREHEWRRSLDMLDDDWTDEPTRADHRFPG